MSLRKEKLLHLGGELQMAAAAYSTEYHHPFSAPTLQTLGGNSALLSSAAAGK